MDSDIQFNTVSPRSLRPGVRPDQDAQFIVAPVGEVRSAEMPIFVDLDVMRDMVAHAYSNKKVELGGVMLGQSLVDDDGKPFVVISDCLRAQHYQATRGSFKFTHQTWSDIGRQLNRRRPNLRIVGWYHTHPGWTVFLSSMDLFICENFFSSPEDVALVIDPCNETAGWFQWQKSAEQRRATMQPSGGFRLFAHQLRRDELNYFSKLYSQEPVMNNDPRYVQTASAEHASPTILVGGQRGWFDATIVFLLVIPVILLSAIAWRVLDGSVASTDSAQEVAAQSLTGENRVLREMLQTMVAADGGKDGLVNNYADMNSENRMLQANLDGQLARVDALNAARAEAESVVAELKTSKLEDSKTIAGLSDQVRRLRDSNEQLSANGGGGAPPDVARGYLWALLVAAAACGGGVLIGMFLSKPTRTKRPTFEPETESVEMKDKTMEALV